MGAKLISSPWKNSFLNFNENNPSPEKYHVWASRGCPGSGGNGPPSVLFVGTLCKWATRPCCSRNLNGLLTAFSAKTRRSLQQRTGLTTKAAATKAGIGQGIQLLTASPVTRTYTLTLTLSLSVCPTKHPNHVARALEVRPRFSPVPRRNLLEWFRWISGKNLS